MNKTLTRLWAALLAMMKAFGGWWDDGLVRLTIGRSREKAEPCKKER